jgi:predicted component of type VI protein secretion system
MQDSSTQLPSDSQASSLNEDAKSSQTPSTVELTRIHHADRFSSSHYWNLHFAFLSIAFVAILVILFSKIPQNSN